jgi:uncharacterized protein (TIGR00369 family)
MNDKTPATAGAAFDPRAHGWEKHTTVGFNDLVGPLWRREDGDGLRLGFLAAQKHLNRIDIVHGGMLMTFADQAMGTTARRATGGKKHATIELNVQFVDSVRLGEFVEAKCEVVRATRSIVFMQAKIAVGTRTVATATGIWKILGEA